MTYFTAQCNISWPTFSRKSFSSGQENGYKVFSSEIPLLSNSKFLVGNSKLQTICVSRLMRNPATLIIMPIPTSYHSNRHRQSPWFANRNSRYGYWIRHCVLWHCYINQLWNCIGYSRVFVMFFILTRRLPSQNKNKQIRVNTISNKQIRANEISYSYIYY